MLKICNFITRYMAVLVLLSAVFSLFFPEIAGRIRTAWISPMLGLVMFGMGLTLNARDLKIVFTRPRDILIGSVAQFTIMPFTAWLLAKAFQLPPEIAVGVILVGCCPGGTASNVITYLAGGDLALSVGMTSVSTLLAPLLTPLLVWLYAGTLVEVDYLAMLLSIVQVVILPIVLGLILQRFWPRLTQKISLYLPAFSSVVIALIVAAVIAANAAALKSSGILVIGVVILHNLSGFALGYAVARLLRLLPEKRTAVSIEVGMQNSGLACALAKQHFAALPMATVAGAVFSVWHNIAGALAARLFKACKS
ncbi:MAG: bile acid:sodium symporter family protein [Paludibacteraceae bacterium]|nr:bile acid:sodium symporter family protein [Paludibacteraceae bacterium]